VEIENRLRQYLLEELQAPEDKLAADYPLITEKVIDSLGLLSIVSFVEGEYGIEVNDDELAPDTFGSIALISKLVESKLAQKA
jgi:acyl carrier protein